MPSPTVPDFTEHGARKLAELLANGYRVTGVCFERQVEGTQPQRGFVDFAGFVGWHKPAAVPLADGQAKEALWSEHLRWMQAAGLDTEGMRPTGEWLDHWLTYVRAIERAHGITAHGVADMKGGQDGD